MQNAPSPRAPLSISVVFYVNIIDLQTDLTLSAKAFVVGNWGAELTPHSDNSLTLRTVLRF